MILVLKLVQMAIIRKKILVKNAHLNAVLVIPI
jgi:hypothetical protein